MEDKRVIKTRRNIKKTFVSLLNEMPFEKMTVAEICRHGVISRVTFYTYYESKYSLLNEILADYVKEADNYYHELQKANNPSGKGFIGYQNLMECILEMFFGNIDFFSHVTTKENPHVFSVFFNHVCWTVDDYIQRHKGLYSKYPTKQTAALICNGLIGVINTGLEDKLSREEVCSIARAMYSDILSSDMFIQDLP